jgi:hypothetical protein
MQAQPELAALRRMAWLGMATSEEMRTGLGLLCVVDPVGSERMPYPPRNRNRGRGVLLACTCFQERPGRGSCRARRSRCPRSWP